MMRENQLKKPKEMKERKNRKQLVINWFNDSDNLTVIFMLMITLVYSYISIFIFKNILLISLAAILLSTINFVRKI
jgi:uncharacterized membrane protein